MFKLLKEPVFDWNVDVHVPVIGADGNNATEAHRFTATFVALPLSEIQSPRRDIRKLLEKVWRGARDLADEDGKPLALTEEVKGQLLDIPYVLFGVWEAYLTAVSGDAARRGN